MSETTEAPPADEYHAITDAMHAAEAGCWENEMCCWSAAEAMRAEVDRILAARLDAVRRKAGDERAEQIAQAIERQKSIAEESRNIVQTPLPKNNFDQQAWAYGDAARIARSPR